MKKKGKRTILKSYAYIKLVELKKEKISGHSVNKNNKP